MRCRRKELVNLLKLSKRFVSKSDFGETTCFMPGKIIGYDGMIFMQVPFAEADVTCAFDLEKLLSVVEGAGGEEVELKLKDGVIEFSSNDTKAELKVKEDVSVFVEAVDVSGVKFKRLPEDLLDAMFLVSFSTSKDIANKVFSCVCVDGDMVFATDNFRVSKYKLKKFINVTFLVPASSVSRLVGFSKEFPLVEFAYDGVFVHFRSKEGAVFSCRLFLDEEFPSKDTILSVFRVEGKRFEFPEGVKDAVKAVSFLVKDQFELDRVVSVSVKGGKVVCRAEKEGEWVEKVVPCGKREKFQFLCNPDFLVEALERAFEVTVGKESILFRSKDGRFEHLVALYVEE